MSISSTSRPQGRAKVRSQWRRPQYMTLGASTWSPGASAWKTAGRRGHAGGEQQAARAALERVEQRLGVVDRRVVGAAVAAARGGTGCRGRAGRWSRCGAAGSGRRSRRRPRPSAWAASVAGCLSRRSWSEPARDGEHAAGGVGGGGGEQPEDRRRDLLGLRRRGRAGSAARPAPGARDRRPRRGSRSARCRARPR